MIMMPRKVHCSRCHKEGSVCVEVICSKCRYFMQDDDYTIVCVSCDHDQRLLDKLTCFNCSETAEKPIVCFLF